MSHCGMSVENGVGGAHAKKEIWPMSNQDKRSVAERKQEVERAMKEFLQLVAQAMRGGPKNMPLFGGYSLPEDQAQGLANFQKIFVDANYKLALPTIRQIEGRLKGSLCAYFKRSRERYLDGRFDAASQKASRGQLKKKLIQELLSPAVKALQAIDAAVEKLDKDDLGLTEASAIYWQAHDALLKVHADIDQAIQAKVIADEVEHQEKVVADAERQAERQAAATANHRAKNQEERVAREAVAGDFMAEFQKLTA